jgi:hypothetical protein
MERSGGKHPNAFRPGQDESSRAETLTPETPMLTESRMEATAQMVLLLEPQDHRTKTTERNGENSGNEREERAIKKRCTPPGDRHIPKPILAIIS